MSLMMELIIHIHDFHPNDGEQKISIKNLDWSVCVHNEMATDPLELFHLVF